MTITPDIASLVHQRMSELGMTAAELADEAGLESGDVVTSIRAGTAPVPLDRVGRLAKALQVDAVQLLRAFLVEYCPDTWDAVSPFLNDVFTVDEVALIKAMRKAIGGPYLVSLSSSERYFLNEFLAALRNSVAMH